jgi:hypothetical protein
MPAFQPIDGLKDTTQVGLNLLEARNILLRPAGAFKGPPTYQRLWGIGSASTIYATLTALGLTDASNTVALRVARQGKNLLFFYNMPARKCRGLFYMGDDGTFSSGSYDFTASSGLAWEILATDLDDTARWYGVKMGGEALYLGNGVDDNVVVQLARSATPGKWRKAASNVAPSAPVISLVSPANSTNTDAYVTFTRTSAAKLTFRVKSELFPGVNGNNKIRVAITNTGAADPLASTLTGQGTVADPYIYTIRAGSTAANSSTDALVTFVNTDSRVTGILTASKSAADAAADSATYGPSDLENGTGTGTSTGFTNRTVTFYARYWDPGVRNYGYEGVSSPISNTLVIPADANNDIRVLVPILSSAESGRFGYIRLYMQFGESPDEVWLLINPDDAVPNGLSGTFTRFGSTNAVELTGSQWADNDVGRLTTTGTLPGGLSTGVDYYLRTRFTGTFVRQSGNNLLLQNDWTENAIVNLSTTGTLPAGLSTGVDYYLRPRFGTLVRVDTNEITLSGSGWAVDDMVRLTTTGTLPGGLAVDTTYYLAAGVTPGQWRLSLSPGGGGSGNVPMSDAGTGTHTATAYPSTQWQFSLTSGGAGVTVTTAGTGIHTATLKRVDDEVFFAATADGPPIALSSAGSGVHTFTLFSKCVQVGTQTPFLPADEGGEMFDDQNRPLPHTLHAFTNDQVWRGGVTSHPERLYVSKPSTADEVAPEGVSLDELAFVTAITQSQIGGSNKITALVASQNRLDCHYAGGVAMRDPANPDEVNFTVTGAGAINQTAVAVWEQRGVYILGGDLQLRMQSVEQTGSGFAAAVASSQFAALAGARYLRDRVDLAELARNPQRVFVFPNVTDQHLYMSLPALDGTLKMFAFDFLNGGIVGEFDYPKIYAAAQMEPDRPEIIFADEDGNLMVWDTSTQADRGDVLATSAAWTAHSTDSAPPAQYAGWGYVDVGSARYYQATTSVLKTGFFDLGSPAMRKALAGILFRCVKNSRARVSVTLRTLDQVETTITAEPAQTYARVEHRLNRMLGRSTSLQLEFRIIGAEQAPWIIRDICGLWLPQGRV